MTFVEDTITQELPVVTHLPKETDGALPIAYKPKQRNMPVRITSRSSFPLEVAVDVLVHYLRRHQGAIPRIIYLPASYLVGERHLHCYGKWITVVGDSRLQHDFAWCIGE